MNDLNRADVDPGSSTERNERGDAAGSRVRARTGEDGVDSRAVRRVAEYVRALGLHDALRVEEVAEAIVAQCAGTASTPVRPDVAVALAQRSYDAFLEQCFGAAFRSIDPLWLRTFFAACPDVFLADPGVARERAQRFGDPWAGRPPTQARFRDQALKPMRLPRWSLGLLPPLSATAVAAGALAHALSRDGMSALECLWVTLFCLLFGHSAIGLSTSLLGFVQGFSRKRSRPALTSGAEPLPRTALVMPVYHENSEVVFAAIAAMRESLASTGEGDAFEIFVLSDSRDPERAAEEERAFRRVASDRTEGPPVYYRRRARNDRQKAGNLAEFFERWGRRYEYAVVLDADSLMRGDTLVSLVRRIHAEPRLALLQAPLTLHRAETVFARVQQFAASVTGPLFTRGLSAWAGPHGNYYGHNAVIRVRAFLECCSLPVLAGEPPLGGHILSHDFVEAALLCRAGWEVRMAPELEGSYEELPPTLPEYVARDRRWCQGNLQHLRIALAEGLAPMSRVHMLVGAVSYLAGPAWVAFVVTGACIARSSESGGLGSPALVALTAATGAVLLGPRLLGLVAALSDGASRRAHGGALRLCASAVFEVLLTAALAPLLMLHHTRIVLSIVIGRTVRWGSQQRRASGAMASVVTGEAPATALGVTTCLALSTIAPELLIPLSPVWAPLVLSIPLALASSSRRVGRLLMRAGVLRVPSETQPDELCQRAEDLQSMTAPDESARFRDLVLDPLLVASQIARLEAAPAQARNAELLHRLCQRALRSGPTALLPVERELLSRDVESLRFLHREAWQHWPVESWQLSRDRAQLPPERPSSPHLETRSFGLPV